MLTSFFDTGRKKSATKPTKKAQISVPVWLFFISCIIESYIYAFLMKVTKGNIICAMTYHFMYNLMIHLTAIVPEDNAGSILPYVFLVLLEAVTAIIFGYITKAKLCEE